ncbi:MAG: YgiT-type zinc finger protein [Caldilineaceae bacterium]
MIGEHANSLCPMCGGTLESKNATIPFILAHDIVVVLKKVPAEVCANCQEPFVAGRATDQVVKLLRQVKALHSEVAVLTYVETPVFA